MRPEAQCAPPGPRRFRSKLKRCVDVPRLKRKGRAGAADRIVPRVRGRDSDPQHNTAADVDGHAYGDGALDAAAQGLVRVEDAADSSNGEGDAERDREGSGSGDVDSDSSGDSDGEEDGDGVRDGSAQGDAGGDGGGHPAAATRPGHAPDTRAPAKPAAPRAAFPPAVDGVLGLIRRHAGSVAVLEELEQRLLRQSPVLPPELLHALLRAYLNLQRLDKVDHLVGVAGLSGRTVPLIFRTYKSIWRSKWNSQYKRGTPRHQRKKMPPVPRLPVPASATPGAA